jgi:hypothetical protein
MSLLSTVVVVDYRREAADPAVELSRDLTDYR